MLDIKILRENFEAVRGALAKRGKPYPLESFLDYDAKRLELLRRTEEMKARQNAASKLIPQLKKEGADTSQLMNEMKSISDELKIMEPQLKEYDQILEDILMSIPNIPHESVPCGETDADNEEVRKWGEPTAFSFEPKPHWEIGEALDILDFPTAAKTTGARFVFYKGMGAKLERALMNFMLDTNTSRGYTEVMPPVVVHRRSLVGTGQLPKFEEDLFKLEGTEYYLNPTAEVPVTNMYREEILDGARLPIYHTAYAPSFRSEAGSAGRDTRGLIRMHQFHKVELVKFTRPENSYDELEKLTRDSEEILRLLNIPYRVVRLCGGDLGFCAAMCYDLEVWMPSYGRYVEIGSCSNFESFQARRAGIRFKDPGGKTQFVHTLNGSGLALSRTHAALLENCQQSDGSVKIPDALIPYMNGTEYIK